MFRFIQSRMFFQAVGIVAVLAWAVVQLVTSAQYVPLSSQALYWPSYKIETTKILKGIDYL